MIAESSMPVVIPSCDADSSRPLWSVMIPAYNCAAYLRESLASVLAQDVGPDQMQIEVVDDCSPEGDPRPLVDEVGRGRVHCYRQPENRGHVRNFNTCLQRARGHLVHLLHGDDTVLPGFYARMAEPFREHPEIGAAFCRPMMTGEQDSWTYLFPLERETSGVLPDWLRSIAVKQRVVPPGIVVRRAVYERLGGFDPRIRVYGEDWEMWVRIAAHYPVWYEPQPLAAYRVRRESLSGSSLRTGENLREIERAIQIFQGHLPVGEAPVLARRARHLAARQAIKDARRALHLGDSRAAVAQLRGALRLSRSGMVLAEMFGLAWWAVRRAVAIALPRLYGRGRRALGVARRDA